MTMLRSNRPAARRSGPGALGSALALAVAVGLAGCNRPADPSAETHAAAASAAASVAPGARGPAPLTPETATIPPPDVGRLEAVTVTAEGGGASASEAVAEALRLAIMQVNGAVVDVSTVNTRLGIDATLNQTTASLRASAFADTVRQASGGVVRSFRIVELKEPEGPGKRFKAQIEAGIARFDAPASLKKIRLVVAPLRFAAATLPMGDRTVPASEAEGILRQRIVDALVATGRFAVLDRDFSPEIEQELEQVTSGRAPAEEALKLRQAVSADLIWVARVDELAYHRHARALRTSDRELVSYSGGWSMSHRLVNVATRQVMLSESLHGTAPDTAPTTLGASADTPKVLAALTGDMVDRVVASVIGHTFPITVLALNGDRVVLSQGGQALRPDGRYAMVTMGAELKDPQTGQSLGRIEAPCCQLVVDRVTPTLAYGRLENVSGSLDNLLPGALQVREALSPAAPAPRTDPATPTTTTGTPPAGTASPRRDRPQAQAAPQSAPAAKNANDDKW
jgi:hypothetical protein